MRKGVFIWIVALGLAAFLSCSQDAYEKGQGDYSLLRGDFAEAYVNNKGEVESVTTDDGEVLPLTKTLTAKWITTADTTYRCMLYYNKVKGSGGQSLAEVLSIGQVPCPLIKPLSDFDKAFRADPVKFESAWVSKSGKYLNMSLQLMTGFTEDTTAIQQLAFVSDTLLQNPDKTSTLYIRLFHDQGNVPEYYSTQAYVSIPTNSIDADSVRISINTYKGMIEKAFRVFSAN